MAPIDYSELDSALGIPSPDSSIDPLDSYVSELEAKFKLPRGIMQRIKHVETGGVADPNAAVSSAGAAGMFQVMPGTAQSYLGQTPYNPQDPRQNAEIAAQHLSRLRTSYPTMSGEDMLSQQRLAAAYNMGEGNYQKYNVGNMQDLSQIPLQETRNYVQKFANYTPPVGQATLSGIDHTPQSPGPDYAELDSMLNSEPSLAENISNKAGAVGDFFGGISQLPGIRQFGEAMGWQKGKFEENVLGPSLGYDPSKDTFGSHTRKLIGGQLQEMGVPGSSNPIVSGLAGGAWAALADMATDPVVLELEALGAALGTLGGPVGMAAGAGAGAVAGGLKLALGKWFSANRGFHSALTTATKVLGKGFQGQMALGAATKLPSALQKLALNPEDPEGYSNLSQGLIDAYFTSKSLIPKAVSKGVGQITLEGGDVLRIEGPDGAMVPLQEASLYTQNPTGLALIKLFAQKRAAAWEYLVNKGYLVGDPAVAPELVISHGDIVGEASPKPGEWIKFNPTRLASELVIAPMGERGSLLSQRIDAALSHELGHWEKDYGVPHGIENPSLRQALAQKWQEYQAKLAPIAQQMEARRAFLEQNNQPVGNDPLLGEMLTQAETFRQEYRLGREQFYKAQGIDPNSVEAENLFQQNAVRNFLELQPVLQSEHMNWEQAFQPEGGLEQALADFMGEAEKVQGITGNQLLHPSAQQFSADLLSGQAKTLSPQEQALNTRQVYDLERSAKPLPTPPVLETVPQPSVDHAALNRPFRPGVKPSPEVGEGRPLPTFPPSEVQTPVGVPQAPPTPGVPEKANFFSEGGIGLPQKEDSYKALQQRLVNDYYEAERFVEEAKKGGNPEELSAAMELMAQAREEAVNAQALPPMASPPVLPPQVEAPSAKVQIPEGVTPLSFSGRSRKQIEGKKSLPPPDLSWRDVRGNLRKQSGGEVSIEEKPPNRRGGEPNEILAEGKPVHSSIPQFKHMGATNSETSSRVMREANSRLEALGSKYRLYSSEGGIGEKSSPVEKELKSLRDEVRSLSSRLPKPPKLRSQGGLGLRQEETRLAYDPEKKTTEWPYKGEDGKPEFKPVPMMGSLLLDKVSSKKFADMKSPKGWLQAVNQKFKAEGVSEDALKWSGIREWLSEKEAKGEKVTQQEVMAHVQAHTTAPLRLERSNEFTEPGRADYRNTPAYLEAKESLKKARKDIWDVASPHGAFEKLGVAPAGDIDTSIENLFQKFGDNPAREAPQLTADREEVRLSLENIQDEAVQYVKRKDTKLKNQEILHRFLSGGEINKGEADRLYDIHRNVDWEDFFERAPWRRSGRSKVISLKDVVLDDYNYAHRKFKREFLDPEGNVHPKVLEDLSNPTGFSADAYEEIAGDLRGALHKVVGDGIDDYYSTLSKVFPEHFAEGDPYMKYLGLVRMPEREAPGGPLFNMAKDYLDGLAKLPKDQLDRFDDAKEAQALALEHLFDMESKNDQTVDAGTNFPTWNRSGMPPKEQKAMAKETSVGPASDPYIPEETLRRLGYDPTPEVQQLQDGTFQATFKPLQDAPVEAPSTKEGMQTLYGEPAKGLSASLGAPRELTPPSSEEISGIGKTREEAISNARVEAATTYRAGEVGVGRRADYGHSSFGQGTAMHSRGEATRLPESLGGTPGPGRDDVRIMGEHQSDIFQRVEKVANTGLTKSGAPDFGWQTRANLFSKAAKNLENAAYELQRGIQEPPNPTYGLQDRGWAVFDWMERFTSKIRGGATQERAEEYADQAYRRPSDTDRALFDAFMEAMGPDYGLPTFSGAAFANWVKTAGPDRSLHPLLAEAHEKALAEWKTKNAWAAENAEKAKELSALAPLVADLGEAFRKAPYIAPWNKDWAEVEVKADVADAISRDFDHIFLRDAAYAKTSAGSGGMSWEQNIVGQWEVTTLSAGYDAPVLSTTPEGPRMTQNAKVTKGGYSYGGNSKQILTSEEAHTMRKKLSAMKELLQLTVEKPENLDVLATQNPARNIVEGEVIMSPAARTRIMELLKENPYEVKNSPLWRWADEALGSQDWGNIPKLWKYSRIINEVDSVLASIEKGEPGSTLKRSEGFDMWYQGQANRTAKLLKKLGWKGEVQRITGDEFPVHETLKGKLEVAGSTYSGAQPTETTHYWGWLFKGIPKRAEVEKDPNKAAALLTSKGGIGFDPLRDVENYQSGGLSLRTPTPINKEAWKESLTKVDHPLWEAINTPRALITSLDLSGVLRQGIVGTSRELLTNPARLANNFRKSLSALRSEDFYNKSMEALEKAEGMGELRKFGMDFAAKEEAYAGTRVLTTLAKKFGLPDFPRASERAYTYYLNRLRFDLARDKFNRLKDMGFTPEKDKWLFESAAKWSNVITGRGNLPTGKDPLSQAVRSAEGLMNTALFSPRLMLSRFAMLNPYVYGRTAMAAGKTHGASGAIGAFWAVHGMDVAAAAGLAAALTYGIKAAFGGDIEEDPRSSDFMQARLGNTRVDLTGGLRTYLTTASRILTGSAKSTIGGNIRDIGALETVGRFLRGKLSPVPGTAADLISGKKVTGEEVLGPLHDLWTGNQPLTKESAGALIQTLIEGPVAGLTVPMIFRDLKSLYQEDPMLAAGLAAPLILGAGVTVHDLRGGLTPKLVQTFKRTMLEPMAPMRAVSTGVKDYSGKQISLGVPYMLRKQIETEIDKPLYEKLEEMVSTPQFEALSPVAQRVTILAALGPLYKMRRGQAMRLMGRDTLAKGIRENMMPKEWKKLGPPPIIPDGEEAPPELPVVRP